MYNDKRKVYKKQKLAVHGNLKTITKATKGDESYDGSQPINPSAA